MFSNLTVNDRSNMRKLVLTDFVQTASMVLDDTVRHSKEMRHSNWKESGETDFFKMGKQ